MATKLIINCATGVTTEVELTAEEVAQREVDAAAFATAESERQAEADAKAAARVSAQAKLKTLGLSDEEIAALI